MMNKALFTLLTAGILVAGCDKENPLGTQDQATTPDANPIYESSTDPEDQISGTSFDRTISITFSDSGTATGGSTVSLSAYTASSGGRDRGEVRLAKRVGNQHFGFDEFCGTDALLGDIFGISRDVDPESVDGQHKSVVPA